MAVQYWVGDHFVDLSRNQITTEQHSQTVPPKALAVLTYLAENHGQVVTYDQLLNRVWPNTVVTPNTLQRSIAQLRKVLGDKHQSIIKTHAKQGYSLDSGVVWQTEVQPTSKSFADRDLDQVNEGYDAASTSNTSSSTGALKLGISGIRPVLVALTFIGLAVALAWTKLTEDDDLPGSSEPQLSFNYLRSLTASDDKEFSAVYSPDGQHIAFHRYVNQLCMNNLWAKNTATQEETRLTEDLGTYSGVSFSPSGDKLAFISTYDCDKPSPQERCYNLMGLDFRKALEQPAPSVLMAECKNTALRDPIWLDDDNIVVMQMFESRWKLIHYSISENKSTVLHEVDDGNLLSFDFSKSESLFAVSTRGNDGKHYIDMLALNGEVLSSNQIQYPDELSKFRLVFPKFDSARNRLIFSSGKLLFALSYDGEVQRINVPLDFKVEAPSFHPNGKSLLLIKKWYDSDVAIAPIRVPTAAPGAAPSLISSGAEVTDVAVVDRSTLEDDNGIFQPNGDLIAFVSDRSGEDQVWLADESDSRKASHFPLNTYINGVDWSEDGDSMLVNANGSLTQLFLDGSQRRVAFEYPVIFLFQWDSTNNSALLVSTIDGVTQFIELNLATLEYQTISTRKIIWAQKSHQAGLVFMDALNRFWQPGALENQMIDALTEQGSNKRFVIRDQVIYGINQVNELWSYDVSTSAFTVLRTISDNVDTLTDVGADRILFDLLVAEKKEVVELSLSE